jgi:hypothetical protein
MTPVPPPANPALPRSSPCRASKSWLDRVLTSSMGTFNEFAAYSPEAAAVAAAAAAGVNIGGGGSSGSVYFGDGEEEAGWAAEGRAPRAKSPQLPRDIVTGEPLVSSSSSSSSKRSGGSASGSHGGGDGEDDPMLASRDIRLEPVNQIARWLGNQPGGGSPEPPSRPGDVG